jgi:hypothetical protein
VFRRFGWEGEDVLGPLEFVPMAVRRKLDLAGVKISLEGWRALSRDERSALCHVPVEADEDAGLFREVLERFAARAGIAVEALGESMAAPPPWRTGAAPERLRARLDAAGRALPDDRWRELDDDTRYALWKLADPKREPAKLLAALDEIDAAPQPLVGA